MTRNLFPLFGEYTQKPEAYFREWVFTHTHACKHREHAYMYIYTLLCFSFFVFNFIVMFECLSVTESKTGCVTCLNFLLLHRRVQSLSLMFFICCLSSLAKLSVQRVVSHCLFGKLFFVDATILNFVIKFCSHEYVVSCCFSCHGFLLFCAVYSVGWTFEDTLQCSRNGSTYWFSPKVSLVWLFSC